MFEKLSTADLNIGTKQRGALSPKDVLLARANEVEDNARKKGYAEGIELGKEAGRLQGFEQGKADGQRIVKEEAQIALDIQIEAFQNDADEIANQMKICLEKWIEEAQNQLINRAIETTERLINAELETNRDAVLTMAMRALAESGVVSQCKIRVNPFDKSTLITHKDQLLKSNSHLKSVEFVDDSSILGGCIIESDSGIIDASANNFLDRLQGEAA